MVKKQDNLGREQRPPWETLCIYSCPAFDTCKPERRVQTPRYMHLTHVTIYMWIQDGVNVICKITESYVKRQT